MKGNEMKGKERKGKDRKRKAWNGMEWNGMERNGKERKGKDRTGQERKGKEREETRRSGNGEAMFYLLIGGGVGGGGETTTGAHGTDQAPVSRRHHTPISRGFWNLFLQIRFTTKSAYHFVAPFFCLYSVPNYISGKIKFIIMVFKFREHVSGCESHRSPRMTPPLPPRPNVSGALVLGLVFFWVPGNNEMIMIRGDCYNRGKG